MAEFKFGEAVEVNTKKADRKVYVRTPPLGAVPRVAGGRTCRRRGWAMLSGSVMRACRWLVKLPRHVAEAWDAAPTGADLGKVRMEIPVSNPTAQPNMTLITQTKSGPVDFQMTFAKDALNMMSFAVAPDQIQVVGTIEHKCDLRPRAFDASYARSFMSRTDTGPKVPLLRVQTKDRAQLAQQHTVWNERVRTRKCPDLVVPC